MSPERYTVEAVSRRDPPDLRTPMTDRPAAPIQLTVRSEAMSEGTYRLRTAVPADTEMLTSLYLRSRSTAMPWLGQPS